MMNTRSRLLVVALLAGCAVVLPGRATAGDTFTDNLIVDRASTNWGKLLLVQGAGSAPTNGLLLYHSYSSNSTAVADDSGNGCTGTVVGATWTNGTAGGAWSFAGSGDADGNHIDLGTNTLLNSPYATGKLTISAWVYPRADNGFIHSTSNQYELGFGCGGNARKIALYVGSGSWMAGSTTLSTNQWQHFSATVDGSNYVLYVNGNVDGSGTCAAIPNGAANPRKTGARYDMHYGLNGNIDEMRIYNRALSASEIRGLYYKEVTPPQNRCRLESGVVYMERYGDVSQGIYTNR